MWHGQEDVAGGFGCPGNTCVGADGNLYEWVQGVDGLGNPVGYWRRYGRRFGRRFRPYIQRAMPYFQQAAPAFTEPPPPPPPMAPPEPAPAPPQAAPAMAGWGLGADELQATLGIGYLGELAQGPDGNLYQWVEGVDGLGNPVGSWLKRLARRATRLAQKVAPFVPGGAAALTFATPFLRQAGVAGYDGIGALYEAPNGALYQMQGFGADDDLNGFAADEELNGFAADEELNGLADEELNGLDADEELRGFADDDIRGIGGGDALSGPEDDLRGLGDERELQGFADDEIHGFADDEMHGFADDEVHGMDGYIREGMNGIDAYIPDAPRDTPWFKAPNQPPPLWSPLW